MERDYIWRKWPRLMQSIEEAYVSGPKSPRPVPGTSRGGQVTSPKSRCAICAAPVELAIPSAPGLCDACIERHGVGFVRGMEVGMAMLVKDADQITQKYLAVARAADARARSAELLLADTLDRQRLLKATAFCLAVGGLAWTILLWIF